MSKKKTTKNDIDTHIGDILKYKTFLLQQAKQSLVNKMKDKLSEVERNGKPDDPVQQCLKEEERERSDDLHEENIFAEAELSSRKTGFDLGMVSSEFLDDKWMC
ncbi:hypothetical protein MAR_016132 [Mya arenaria]|uniref:Uncharacterized protein n=1 Tax=Mya arenaria TaxID=6604 RepID=A0ABY7FIY8_MYAAR|nr:hypothetical protein MAR_016132 [Mya arenaria]